MSGPRRVGLVGFGAIAENAHLPALRGLGVEIAAVAEATDLRRQAAAELLPGVRVHANHKDLLSKEKGLEALIVATPPSFHAGAVLDGLKARLHVLCEKPLTLDPEAYAAIRAEASKRGVCAYSVNNWAHSPQWSLLLKTVAAGAVGAVRHAEIRVLRTRPSAAALPGDWRKDPAVAGGGILVDHGWHNLYLMRRLLGARARLSSAALDPRDAVDETATVLLEAPGASGTIFLTWKAAERSNSALVVGEKGAVELRDAELVLRAGGREETVRFPEKLSGGSAHPEWLAAMWPSFAAECAGQGRGESLDEAGFCLATIRAAYGAREAAHA